MERYVSETSNQGATADSSLSFYNDSRNYSACNDSYRFQQERAPLQRVYDSLAPNASLYYQSGDSGDRQIIVVSPTVPTDQTPVQVPMPLPPTDGTPLPYPPAEHHGGLGRALGHVANFALNALAAVHVGVYGRHGGVSIGGGYPYSGGYGYGGYGYGAYDFPHRGYCDDSGYVNVDVNRYDGGYHSPYGNYNAGYYNPECGGGYYNPGYGREYHNPGYGGGYYNPGYGGGYYNPGYGGGYYNPGYGGGYHNPGYGGGYYNPGCGGGYYNHGYGGGYYHGGYGAGGAGAFLNLMINRYGHGQGFHGFHHHRR